MNSILIIDDEQSIIDTLSLILKKEKYNVTGCTDGNSALKLLADKKFDLILLDIKMPRMDGLEVLTEIMKIDEDNVVIMISGHGTVETAFEASKSGAYSFLQKPLPDLVELRLIIKNAIRYKLAKDELKKIKNELLENYKLIGESSAITHIKDLISKYSDINSNIYVYGESGTGKELVARQIHLNSKRNKNPFVKINCANLDPDIIENELFGYINSQGIPVKGKFEEAQGGTIYFDEISNLNSNVQSKLLKVLEENKFVSGFDGNQINIDIRFLFSSNKDINLEIDENRFRNDLFHRINVLQINIPPLRERAEDIPELIRYYTEKICKFNNIPLKKFSQNAEQLLKEFRYPGNIRELKNLLERILITIDNNLITAEDIELNSTGQSKELSELLNKNIPLSEFQNESEKMFIKKILNDYKYNVSQTADALKIQRSHLYKLMAKYNIPLPSKRN
ncbi:MAG: sigma-54-dependent Fis family transcriptional regulator [Ignavibacteria bacterium]|nr:sigma-54-dependent Fis family transcriptional regulator [Ignavibacteria bacterium]